MERFAGREKRPRVGLVWSGNPHCRPDRSCSLPFLALASLVSEQYETVSLQKELRALDWVVLQTKGKVRYFGEH